MSVGFRYALAFTLHHEGGYVADLGDGAGETHWGITKRSYPTLDIAALTLEEATALYQRDFWDGLNLDRLPIPLAVAVFDAAVNHGPTGATKLLQGVVGVAVDGVLGPLTQAAAQAQARAALEAFHVARACRYAENAQVGRFGRSWYRRLLACARYCQGVPS